MPIKFNSNNRVLNSNARAADVAKHTLQALTDVQNRKYQAAFEVHGFKAVLYLPLQSGQPCACRRAPSSILGPDGKASQALINEMLTGEKFEIAPYGVSPKNPTDLVEEEDFELLESIHTRKNAGKKTNPGPMTAHNDIFSTNQRDPRARTIVPSMDKARPGESNGGFPSDEWDNLMGGVEYEEDIGDWGLDPEENERLVSGLAPASPEMSVPGFHDISCPICFGHGYVGGYSIYNGYRKVISLSSPPPSLVFSPGSYLVPGDSVPFIEGCEWLETSVVLPSNAQGIDAFRTFHLTNPVPAKFYVDSQLLQSEHELLHRCDGKPHQLRVEFQTPAKVSHVEIQINQSQEWALFEFPKISRSGNPLVLDDTDPFTINMSPKIPRLVPRSVIAESTYHKILLVKNSQPWNTRERTVLGWDCEVRVVEPTELLNILPRRKSLFTPNRPPLVRDNARGPRRT